MSTHPDFITVETSQMARVEAHQADIFVSVAGASLFSGAMALQKAREVAELVAALKAVGVVESQIKVEGVRAQNVTGTFSKSSAVVYNLRLENVALERIADAIGAITNSRNVTLSRLEWRFPEETPLRDEMRAACLQVALERARIIAQTLNVRLIGVYELKEDWQGTRDETVSPRGGHDSRGRSRAMRLPVSEEELGLAVTHAEQVDLTLNIQFRVSEIEN